MASATAVDVFFNIMFARENTVLLSPLSRCAAALRHGFFAFLFVKAGGLW
jgi:hypothetical protein